MLCFGHMEIKECFKKGPSSVSAINNWLVGLSF